MYKIKDEFRKNELSLEPGGSEVIIHYSDEARVYDKVKNPEAFSRAVIKKCEREGKILPVKIETKNKILWEKS
jgi:hypothetical protein